MRMTFDQWKKQVDLYLQELCGMEADDLPDWGYRDAWEDDCTPKMAARRAISAARNF